MFNIYFHGPLKVLISYTGAVIAVQDRISGEAASLHFSPAYIARATRAALNADASLHSEA